MFGHLPRQRPPRFPGVEQARQAADEHLQESLERNAPDLAELHRQDGDKALGAALEDASQALRLAYAMSGNVGQIAEHLEMSISATDDARALLAERNQ